MVRRVVLLFVPFVLLVAACSSDGSPTVEGPTTTVRPTTSTTASSSTTTTASPGATVTTTPPGPGIPLTGAAGSGSVTYSLESARSEFCYRITVAGIGRPGDAHVARTTGEVVLKLVAPAEDGTVNTCAAADSLFIDEVKSAPGNFAVVVVGPKGTLKATLK